MSAMVTKLLAALSLMTMLSGCVITPRIEMTRRIDFNYVYQPQAQLSYNDIMCCARCTA